jgi:hypothetical protein
MPVGAGAVGEAEGGADADGDADGDVAVEAEGDDVIASGRWLQPVAAPRTSHPIKHQPFISLRF